MNTRETYERSLADFFYETDNAFATLEKQVVALNSEAVELREQIAVLSKELDDCQASNLALQGERDDLRDRIAEAEVEIDRLQALVNSTGTVFGACPTNGVSGTNPSLASMQALVDKFGQGVAVRTFIGQSATLVKVNRLLKESVAKMHVSWKPTSVGVITDAAVENACANLLPGDVVEVWHESDKKVRDGVFTMSECLARKNAFYDAVKRVRPDLVVVNTLTGWEADKANPSTQGNLDKWAAVRADLLGLDLDGVNTYPYPNYDSEIATAKEFVAKFNKSVGGTYTGWAVPEFTTARSVANDPDGSKRIAWFQGLVPKITEAHASYVCWFDYNNSPYEALELPNEIAAWKAYI